MYQLLRRRKWIGRKVKDILRSFHLICHRKHDDMGHLSPLCGRLKLGAVCLLSDSLCVWCVAPNKYNNSIKTLIVSDQRIIEMSVSILQPHNPSPSLIVSLN